jgi:hypothetical protein
METLASEHFANTRFCADVALVRFPLGQYRVLINYMECSLVRGSGYLTTRGFRDNQDRAAWNHYQREVTRVGKMAP